MNNIGAKINHVEDMIRGEKGYEIEAVAGALQAVFKFTLEQSERHSEGFLFLFKVVIPL